ncbi:hypothetical protein [Bradyrhizobium sp. 199]|uniref:hypothetical protein n=1 Tax=Bradyrhizobium sp. 199 TaxID=2782664 RepID=UPI001FF7A02E|nr:hypothetical protein [Bradyrhizobium sp. 199]MCK1357356.1 hypothetical protein [Bradyrhizobium sp. 199]
MDKLALVAKSEAWCHIVQMFKAQIVLVDLHGPDDAGISIHTIAEEFFTKEEADQAARFYLTILQRPIGTATYRVVDNEGTVY